MAGSTRSASDELDETSRSRSMVYVDAFFPDARLSAGMPGAEAHEFRIVSLWEPLVRNMKNTAKAPSGEAIPPVESPRYSE